MKTQNLADRLRVDDPKHFRLADRDPADSCGLEINKAEEIALVHHSTARLAELQSRLQAERRRSVLVVLQGMDTSGKDGAIGHVMSGVNPQGCQVHSFKQPGGEELEHDFLWRIALRVPQRGHIAIFNRSHYEDVLVVRVHPELLSEKPNDKFWERRFSAIRQFERHLTMTGTTVLKFFLHISKAEQRQRLLERIDDPNKRWKFSPTDVSERRFWHQYMTFYEDAIRRTSIPEAPWHVVPADHKWFGRLAIAATLVDALERLDPQFPRLDADALRAVEMARTDLLGEN